MLESLSFFALIAVALMILGVVGSITPMVPGALLSIAGILVYYWSTGYTRPGIIYLIGFILVGLIAVLTDYFAGSIAAKAGGASTKTSIIAGVVGFLMFFVAGPIGILVGVAGTVFLREFLISGDKEESMKAAGYSTLGVLGSTVVQLLITVSLLIAFIIALII
jgi:uncharacterized protein YqgC (DUF456 family)